MYFISSLSLNLAGLLRWLQSVKYIKRLGNCILTNRYNLKKTLLWSSTELEVAENTILTLSDSAARYSFLVALTRLANDRAIYIGHIFWYPNNTTDEFVWGVTRMGSSFSRGGKFTSATTIQVEAGYTGTSKSPRFVVPWFIWGVN